MNEWILRGIEYWRRVEEVFLHVDDQLLMISIGSTTPNVIAN